jgi:tetrathionate reductase subunit B
MKVSRRDFLKYTCLLVPAGAIPLSRRLLGASAESAAKAYRLEGHEYAFIVDSRKCIGCGECVRACNMENKVPEGFVRTWVERYTVAKDGNLTVDSTYDIAQRKGKGDRCNFEELKSVSAEEVAKAFFVPKLCNHCEDPPCVPVCPVGATYKSPDGVVLTDPNYCVGCGYCIQACPYGARFLNPISRAADKCTWCYHRITQRTADHPQGLLPACVEICPTGARQFGDAADPDSPMAKALHSERVDVLRKELGTHPKVYCIGLDAEVR